MSATKSILLETASFAAELLCREEKSKYYPENLPNFTNPVVSNIEKGNGTLTFKESISQYDRLEFVENMRNKIGAHKNNRNWYMRR